ncbi:MAG: hypothetical protein N3F09_02075 [Bacteroidia bacterium]|nr:hypothetical protein [Bacteroidia bacterium]
MIIPEYFISKIKNLVQLLNRTENTCCQFTQSSILKLSGSKGHINIVFYVHNPPDKKEHDTLYFPADIFLMNPEEKLAGYVAQYIHPNKRIFARNTEFKIINSYDAKLFLTTNHLMNYAKSHVHFSLFYKDIPYMMVSVGKGRQLDRYSENKKSYELTRICTKLGYTVSGGLSKIITNLKKYFPDAADFVTYVDSGWADGRGLEKCGFQKEPEPMEYYFKIDIERKKITSASENELVTRGEYLRKSFPVWKYRLMI